MCRINAAKFKAKLKALAVTLLAVWALNAFAAPHTVILGVVLNGAAVSSGEAFLEDDDAHLLASATFLQRWNLRTDIAVSRMVEGVAYCDISDMAGLQVQRDAARAEVTLIASNIAFNPRAINANANSLQPPVVLPYAPGGFVNYDLALTQTPQGDSHDALLGFGLFAGTGLLTNTFALRDASSVRLMSSYQSDNPQTMKSLRVGDAVNTTGAWGLGVLFGGMQYGSNFAVRPDFIAQAMPSVAGDALLPSTVDVYVNNVLRTRQNVEAGPFAIQNLPLVNGQGDLQMVVRDVLGREQVVTQSFMASPALLREGLVQDVYEVGAVRRNYGLHSDDYGDPFASVTVRRGMQSQWTAELRAEAQRAVATVGVSNAVLLPQWSSVVEATVAASTGQSSGESTGESTGSMLSLLYSYTGRTWAFNARSALTSSGFRQIGSDPNNLPERLSSLQAATPLGAGTLIANYLSRTNQNAEPLRVLNLSYAQRLNAAVFATVSVLTTNVQSGATLLAGVTVLLDRTHFSSASVNHSAQADTVMADFAKIADSAEGVGYRLATARGQGGATDSADFTSNHAFGSWGAQAQRQSGASGSDTSTRLWATGGAASLGSGVYLSRGIAESFAIVQVGQTAGVPVYLESQLVARTRADGSALVNNLRAYQDNRVSVDPLAVPLDSSMGAMSQTVRPRWLGGVALDFAVRPAVGMTLTLLQVDGTLMPPWTAVDVLPKANAPEDASRFVVGRRGEVFVEFAQPGSYGLRATPPGGTPCYVELQAVAHTQSPLPLQCK